MISGLLAAPGFIKAIVIAIAVAAVTSLISGGYLYIKSKDNKILELQDTIGKKDKAIAQLQIENATLEGKVALKDLENQNIIKETEAMAEAEKQAQETVIEFKNKLEDKNREERINQILAGKKATLLLRMSNSAANCELKNFARLGGKCIGSVWVEDKDEQNEE